MGLPSILDVPEVSVALESLVDEVDDVIQAEDKEARKAELMELISEAISVGLTVGSHLALLTPTPIDDIAIRTIRMLDLVGVIKRVLGVQEEEGQ